MLIARLAGIAALLLALAPAGARASSLVDQALGALPVMESVSGMPIVVLARTGDDPGAFWLSAMQDLCSKTGDNWCEGDVQVLQDTTNLLGWARVLTYTPEGASAPKKVCAILPPAPGVSPGFVAQGIAGGGAFSYTELPSQEEAEAYLYLIHLAACASTGANDAQEQRRSDAFAALSLTLMEGSSSFVSGREVSPARRFAGFRNAQTTGWAVSVGERILLDLWKGQAVTALQASGCAATGVASTSIDTLAIPRDRALPPGQNCAGNYRTGTVTDGNLWLWMGGTSQPYAAFQTFPSAEEGIRYSWQTAASLSTQTAR